MPDHETHDPPQGASGALAPDNLPYQMYLLVQQMTRSFQEVLAPHNLTPLHWGILCCLWCQDGLRPTEIAQQLEQLGGTITVGLAAMVKRRLIRRIADPADGRVARLYLTPLGRTLEAALVPQAQGLIGRLFAPLSPAEFLQLQQQIAALRRHLAQPVRNPDQTGE